MYLTLNNVSKIFPPRGGVGEVIAVRDVNLTINKGELVTLLGPSGCGKTTTLRMIAGFEFPSEGEIVLDGEKINNLPTHKRDMSMVFQSYAIFPHLNVFENIAYGLRVKKLSNDEVNRRVDKVLELVQLVGYGNRAPNQMSGGQQQRVALARALVMEPKVLLMDEPLSNLDAKLREEMRGEIRRIQQTLNITSVYVTHDQIEAMTLSDRIVIMNNGVIEQEGTPSEIYRKPKSHFVAGFIGRANFVPGEVISQEGGQLSVAALGGQVVLPDVGETYASGQKVTLIARPEMVKVQGAAGKFPAVVRRAVYLGDIVEYEVEVAGELLTGLETDPDHMDVLAVGGPAFMNLYEKQLRVLPAKGK